jgi:excisionase family DNA binding protein
MTDRIHDRYTTTVGEMVEYDATPEEAAFLARVRSAVEDPRVTVGELTDLVYGLDNPVLERGIFPARGAVTKAVFARPIYHVMLDLLDVKRLQHGQLDMAAAARRYSMTIAEAAEQLGVHTSAVRQAVQAHKIAARKQGGSWLLDPASVEAYRVTRGPSGGAA